MRGEAEFEEKKGRDWLFWVGVTIVAVVVFLAAFGPNIAPYDPTLATMRVVVPPPSFTEWPGLFWGSVTGQLDQPPHWFGTDATGFDIFSRVISAPRVDLTIALAGRSTGNIVIALALLYTPIYIRLTRSEVLSQRVRGYVEAARALGNPEIVVALRHVLPNSLAPALIQSSVTIGFAILLTAGLSFVGAGVRPPAPEWGLMISSGANQIILGEWWPSVFPGIAISLTVFGFAVLGTALERRYDA